MKIAYLTLLTTSATERADGALDALYTAGHEAGLITSGLWALADRPAEEVRTTLVHTEPTRYFDACGVEIREWAAQLLAQAEEETGE